MSITRRTLLRLLVGCSGAGALGAALTTRVWSPHPPAGETDDETVVAVLTSAAQAIIGLPVERDHYQAYFRWRLQHLAERAQVYRRAAKTLDDRSRRAGRTFVAASEAERLRLCEDGLDAKVRNEILNLFMATDAWIALGYRGWPGMARGFEDYRGPRG